MLVRLGATASLVPTEQRFARARRALPGSRTATACEPPRPVNGRDEPSSGFDARTMQQAVEAYRAADLVQPRPGLFLHVQA